MVPAIGSIPQTESEMQMPLHSSCKRTLLDQVSSENMLLTSPGPLSEVSAVEEQLQVERQKSAQLRATLEERDAALVQLQSTLALGGQFVTVDTPGVSEATREEIERLMELSARALAAKEAEIERLKSQHAKALFHQKMWVKRELLRIIPEMAHNLNRWHFSLVNRINDMLPTDDPEGEQSVRTSSLRSGSAPGTNQVQPSGPAMDQVNAQKASNYKPPPKGVHPRMKAQSLATPREPAAIGHKKRTPAEKAASKKKAASQKGKQAEEQKDGRSMSKKVAKKGTDATASLDMQLSTVTGTRKSSRKRDKTRRIEESRKEEPPAKKLKRYHESVQDKQVEAPKSKKKEKHAAKPSQEATKKSHPASMKSLKKVGELGSKQKVGQKDKDLRTNWGTELLMTPHFVPEWNFARLDRLDSNPGVEKKIPMEGGHNVEERPGGLETAEIQEGGIEKGETEMSTLAEISEPPVNERETGERAPEIEEVGEKRKAPVEEPGKEVESWQDAEECPTKQLEAAQDEKKSSESAQEKGEASGERSSPLESEAPEDVEKSSEEAIERRPRFKRLREGADRKASPVCQTEPENARGDVPPFSETSLGQRESPQENQAAASVEKRAVEKDAESHERSARKASPKSTRNSGTPELRAESVRLKEPAASSEKSAEAKDERSAQKASPERKENAPKDRAPEEKAESVQPPLEATPKSTAETESAHKASAKKKESAHKSGSPELRAENAPSEQTAPFEATPRTTAETESAQQNNPPTREDFNAKLCRRVRCLRRGLGKEETFGWLAHEGEGKRKPGPCWIWCECATCCVKGDEATVPLTPPEFERHAGCARKNWRVSITFEDSGKSLREELGDVPLQRPQKRV